MIISTVGKKGGSTKTTTCLHVGAAAEREGYEVLIVDTDNSDDDGGCTSWATSSKDAYPNLTVVSVPDHKALRSSVPAWDAEYDLVIIDGPASKTLDDLFKMTIALSQLLIIPVKASALDLWRLQSLVQMVEKGRGAKEMHVRFMAGDVDNRTTDARELKESLAGLSIPLFETHFSHLQAFTKSLAAGRTALDWDNARAKEEALALFREIKQLFGIN